MPVTGDNTPSADDASRQRSLTLKLVRAVFAVLVTTFAALAVFRAEQDRTSPDTTVWWLPSTTWIIFGTTLLMVAAVLAVDRFTRVKKISTIAGTLLGVLAGLLATAALSTLIDMLLRSWFDDEDSFNTVRPFLLSIKLIMGTCLTYLGVITVLQTQDDFRLVIPYVEFSKQLRGVRPVLIDSSVLVDGRVADVAATHFLQSPLVIPRFVVTELQTLADSGDALKRTKGRRGLDVISRLQRLGTVDVSIDETPVAGKAVDQMLVELARAMRAHVMTTDVGLSRVAAIHNVPVLNLHELANATRSSLVPGEPVTVRLMRQGEQVGQAVGYLPDGTMVVAEDGSGHIGETVTMTVTSSLQTSAGRMIFARIGEAPVHGHDGSAEGQREEHPRDGAMTAESSAPAPERSPHPPKSPRSLRVGTPRNPRR